MNDFCYKKIVGDNNDVTNINFTFKGAGCVTLRYFEILVSLWTFRILNRAEYPLKNAYPMWLLFFEFIVFLSRILESHSFYFHQMKHNRHSQTAPNLQNYSNSQHSNILNDNLKKWLTPGNSL